MTPRNKDARAQGDDKGSKAGGGGGCSSRRVRVQHTESAGVVDIGDEFSWCCDFNRRVSRGDGLWPKSHAFFFFSFFFFILKILFLAAPEGQSNKYKTRYQRKASTKKPRKNPTVRKTKKTQICRRSTREEPSAAKAFHDPQLQVFTKHDHSSRVIVPGPYGLCCGANGRTCGELG